MSVHSYRFKGRKVTYSTETRKPPPGHWLWYSATGAVCKYSTFKIKGAQYDFLEYVMPRCINSHRSRLHAIIRRWIRSDQKTKDKAPTKTG